MGAHPCLDLAELRRAPVRDVDLPADCIAVRASQRLDLQPAVRVPVVPEEPQLVRLALRGYVLPARNKVQVTVLVIVRPSTRIGVPHHDVGYARHVGEPHRPVVCVAVAVQERVRMLNWVVHLHNPQVHVSVVVIVRESSVREELVLVVEAVRRSWRDYGDARGVPDISEVPGWRTAVDVEPRVVADVPSDPRPDVVLVSEIRCEQVQISVIVHIRPGRTDRVAVVRTIASVPVLDSSDAPVESGFRERSVSIVQPQIVRHQPVVGDVSIEVPVIIEVSPGDPSAVCRVGVVIYSRRDSDIRESPVAIVVVEYVWIIDRVPAVPVLAVRHVEVEEAVAVVVAPARRRRRIVVVDIPRRDGHVGERPVAVVPPEDVPAVLSRA